MRLASDSKRQQRPGKTMLPLVLVSVLLLRKCAAIEPNSLTATQQRILVPSAPTADKPRDRPNHDEHEVIGLIDHGGRTRVVLDSWRSLPTGHGKRRGVSHIKASLLSIGLFATLIRNLFSVEVPTRNDWVAFGFLMILYLVESATCSTRRYLSNIQSPFEARDYVCRMQEVPPRIRFHLECFHYEDDDNPFRYDASSQRRQSGNSKRVTYRASELFEFQTWRDATKLKEVEKSLNDGSSANATYLKMTLTKLVLFRNVSSYQDYLSQHERFVAREGNFNRSGWLCSQNSCGSNSAGDRSACKARNLLDLHCDWPDSSISSLVLDKL